MNETMWAVLLRPVLGPVLMFCLFGAAWLAATLIWKGMPASKARAWLFQPLTPSRAFALGLLGMVLVLGGVVLNEAIPDLRAYYGI